MSVTRARHLPTEILLLIRGGIDPSDLRTHVCYYLSSRTVAALYDSEQDADEFWELACWHCGLGLTPADEDADRSWRDIAIECIKADGFCTLPGCGESLLRQNRYDMEQAIYDHGLAPLDVYLDADRGVVFEAHPALGHIRFTGGYGARLMQDAVVSDAASGLFPYFEGNRYALGAHPILCRSFATFAPTTKMMLRPVAGVAPDRSPEGYRLVRTNALTIYDVVHAIHAELDRPLTVQQLINYVRIHEKCLPETVTESYLGPLRRLQTLRDILSICSIKGYTHVADNDQHGPVFEVYLHG